MSQGNHDLKMMIIIIVVVIIEQKTEKGGNLRREKSDLVSNHTKSVAF